MLIGISAATAASLWLYLHSSQRDSMPYPVSQQAELYINQPRWTLFDREGRLSGQLHAQRLEQWAGEEAARLVQPQLYINDRQQRQWRAHARTGWLYPDNRPFLLEQAVVMHQEPENSGLFLETTRLRIERNGDSVETDAAVVLRAGSWHFSAKGMRANLGQQQLELLTQVRGIHEQTAKPVDFTRIGSVADAQLGAFQRPSAADAD
jgi:LPS export ABC transporter protein LptC